MKHLRVFALLFGFALSPSAIRSAEVSYVPAREYPAVAEREIDAARSSVRLHLYLFSYHPAQPESLPARLAKALARARRRGVEVRVVLDPGDAPWQEGARNREAARFLQEAGVDVSFSSGTALHAKALVVDGAAVLLGSSNWSSSAFADNAETNVLIRSSEVARGLDRDLQALPRAPLPPPPSGAPVPEALLSPGVLGPLVRNADERALDAYLFLLAQAPPSGGFFTVDTGALAAALGLPGPGRLDDRRQIHRVLERLRDRYRLIGLQEAFGRDPRVRLINAAGAPDFPPLLPKEGLGEVSTISLPADYFRWRWDRRLSLAAKVFYLLGLRCAAPSPASPRWSVGQEALARRHGVSAWFLKQGVTALRRADLLEVEYGPLTRDAAPRPASVYTLNPFYDPAERRARLAALERVSGPAAVARAKKIAALLYEDGDVGAIEQFVRLEARHGRPVMERASRILGAKNPDNPKRSVGYFIGTVEGLSKNGPR